MILVRKRLGYLRGHWKVLSLEERENLRGSMLQKARDLKELPGKKASEMRDQIQDEGRQDRGFLNDFKRRAKDRLKP
jgi:hypothetical protein